MIHSSSAPDLTVVPSLPDGFESSALYFNGELSQLEFNRRVLAQAQDARLPLLERVRFLAICSGNLDEFFELRVAGLRGRRGEAQPPGPDGMSARETLQRVRVVAEGLLEAQYALLNHELLPALAAQNVLLAPAAAWTAAQTRWLRRYFECNVVPLLSPILLDRTHPFPEIPNKCLSLLLALEWTERRRAHRRWAVVQAPRVVPRLLRLPPWLAGDATLFVLLSQVMQHFAPELLGSMSVREVVPFRITRNGDLVIEDEESGDLLSTLVHQLPRRPYSGAVRLEVARQCSEEAADFLLRTLGIEANDLYRVDDPVNLSRLGALYDLVERPELKFPPFVARTLVGRSIDMFAALRRQDILLHHPYESIEPVVALLQQAASDPHVLAIKQTVYRVDSASPVLAALLSAARRNKEVTVVIELRARFDEAANIEHAERLRAAGVKVVYGVVGYKTHAKMLLVVRREGARLRRYVHLATGNYNLHTSRCYTDFGLLTSDPSIGHDVQALFLLLTGRLRPLTLKSLWESPHGLHAQLLALIEGEAAVARGGGVGHIMARVNALTEPQLIMALYRASQAGVKIDLLVRGMCCLRPGVPGLSTKITVRSVVDRFLEHSRVYYFRAGGADVVRCASADWMPRNLFKRVEVAFPLRDPVLRDRVVREALSLYYADNTHAWQLGADGTYTRLTPAPGQRPQAAQQQLLDELARPARPRATFHDASPQTR